MPFKCEDCGEDTLLVYFLSVYGQSAYGVRDDNEYCKKCFDARFEDETKEQE